MTKPKVVFELDAEMIGNIRKTFADRSSVEIGVMDADRKLMTIARAHEFGARVPVTEKMRRWFAWYFGVPIRKDTMYIHIPQRSYLRKTVAQKHRDFISFLRSQTDMLEMLIVSGQWKIALDIFGSKWASFIRTCFKTGGFGQWDSLSPLTIFDKSGFLPLTRSGRLKESIKHKVNAK